MKIIYDGIEEDDEIPIECTAQIIQNIYRLALSGIQLEEFTFSKVKTNRDTFVFLTSFKLKKQEKEV